MPRKKYTVDEKMAVVRRLNDDGFFLMKGAVSQVAAMLGSSEATIYRYLGKISKENKQEV